MASSRHVLDGQGSNELGWRTLAFTKSMRRAVAGTVNIQGDSNGQVTSTAVPYS